MIIYIASPYTLGDPVLNVRNQIEAAEELRVKGHLPFIPLLSHLWHLCSPHNYTYWTEMDLEWLEHVDAVLRLPGKSSGADAEVARAIELGIPVYYSVGEV